MALSMAAEQLDSPNVKRLGYILHEGLQGEALQAKRFPNETIMNCDDEVGSACDTSCDGILGLLRS